MKAGLASILAAVYVLAAPAAWSTPPSPNDPAWPMQWGPVATRTVDVWAKGTGSPDVVVAVVDTGVAPVPDLAGALVPGIDLVGGGVAQEGSSELGYHGTWVASIIAARGNNGRGMAGYCWRCSIMPVRVGDGVSPTSGDLVARGIVWAVDHGADVVNVSLAGDAPSAAEADAVAYAAAKGAVVVAAAGNSGDASKHYPGAYPGVLAVAGTDEHDVLYPWSTRGAWVPLAAPGCATVVDPVMGTATGCGSSLAPAAVAGIAGLLLSFSPSRSADEVAAALRSSARAVEVIGGGRVDAAAAFAALALPEVASVPPPARPETAPAAAAASVEATMLSGSLAYRRAFRFESGRGRVVARFAVPPSASCQLRLELGSAVVVGITQRGAVTLEARAESAGTKLLRVTCATSTSVPFRLELERRL